MTHTYEITLDVSGFAPFIDTVDGEPLVERLHGGPTIDTWLATLWGIRPGQSSPRGGLSTDHVQRLGGYWLYTL